MGSRRNHSESNYCYSVAAFCSRVYRLGNKRREWKKKRARESSCRRRVSHDVHVRMNSRTRGLCVSGNKNESKIGAVRGGQKEEAFYFGFLKNNRSRVTLRPPSCHGQNRIPGQVESTKTNFKLGRLGAFFRFSNPSKRVRFLTQSITLKSANDKRSCAHYAISVIGNERR